jgi:hypothetical protein
MLRDSVVADAFRTLTLTGGLILTAIGAWVLFGALVLLHWLVRRRH